MKRYLVEGVGTFFFFLTFSLAGMTGNVLPVGFMLMALIYIGAHISGAHYNPALSTASWLRGALPLGESLRYKAAQAIGAVLVGVLFYAMTNQFLVIPVQGPILFGVVSEALLSFIFCSVFLVLATTDRYKVSGLAGLVIGFTLIAVASLGGTVNPAFGFCSLLGALAKSDSAAAFDSFIVLVVGPMLGALLSAWWFKYLNPEARTTPGYQYQ